VFRRTKETANPKRKKRYKPKSGQYGLTAGLCKFGKKGEFTVNKELQQFNTYNVFDPVDAKDLTTDDRKNAFASLIFLKAKQNGEIKARSWRTVVSNENILRKKKLLPPP
jgi:hypothetical protein